MGQKLGKLKRERRSIAGSGDSRDGKHPIKALWTDEEEESSHLSVETPPFYPDCLLENASGVPLPSHLLQYIASLLDLKDQLALRRASKRIYDSLAFASYFETLSVKKEEDVPKNTSLPSYRNHLKQLHIDNSPVYGSERQVCARLLRWLSFGCACPRVCSLRLVARSRYGELTSIALVRGVMGAPWAHQLTTLHIHGLDGIKHFAQKALDLSPFVSLLDLSLGVTFGREDCKADTPRLLASAPPTLTSLSMFRLSIEQRIDEVIQKLPNLVALEMREPDSTESAAFLIEAMKRRPIERLRFQYGFLDECVGLSNIDATSLKVLDGHGKVDTFKQLINAPRNLTNLDWKFQEDLPPFSVILELVSRAPELASLSLRTLFGGTQTFCYDGEGDESVFKKLSGLQHLQLPAFQFNAHMFDSLLLVRPPLRSLRVGVDPGSLPSLNMLLRELPLLNSLTLPCFDDETLFAVSRCSDLSHLLLPNSNQESYSDAGIIAIANGCHKIVSLEIAGLALLTDDALTAVAEGMPSLEYLECSHLPLITDASIIAIAQGCQQLRDLQVVHCPQLTDVSLRALHKYLNNETFEIAYMGGSQIDDMLARKWTQESRERGKFVSVKADFYD